MELINPLHQSEAGIAALRTAYDTAAPYPHVVIDNFLTEELAESLFSNFPAIDQLKVHYSGLNEKKSEGSNFEAFHPDFSRLRDQMQTQAVSEWMGKVTGITDLQVTNDSLGCGLHQGTDGSYLDPHVDFSLHNRQKIYRRFNLLIYMNKGWNPAWGGALELWNKDMTQLEKTVEVVLNRAVIFECSDISYHGYSKISVPEGVSRKSFYTYFYHTDPGNQSVGYHDTIFKAKPTDSRGKKAKTAVKERLKNTAKRTFKKLGIKF